MSDGRDGESHDDLPPTEAMPTPFRPYRPGTGQPPPPLIEPLAEPSPRSPFPWEQQAPAQPAPRSWEPPVERSPAPVPPRPFVPELGDRSAAPAAPPTGPSDLDAVFGASAFQEYEPDSPFAVARRSAEHPRERAAREPHGPRERDPQRILIIVAAAVIGVLILALAFVIGTRNPELLPAAAPAPAATAPVQDEPTDAAPAIGPVAPGEHPWNELLGTECVEPFAGAWEQSYTVVDCTQPHAAQLLAMVVLDDDAASVWPGDEELADRASSVCGARSVVDYDAARELTDLQVIGSYPATADAWAAGDRTYSCWVSRSSGEPLTGSLAVAPETDAEDTD